MHQSQAHARSHVLRGALPWVRGLGVVGSVAGFGLTYYDSTQEFWYIAPGEREAMAASRALAVGSGGAAGALGLGSLGLVCGPFAPACVVAGAVGGGTGTSMLADSLWLTATEGLRVEMAEAYFHEMYPEYWLLDGNRIIHRASGEEVGIFLNPALPAE